MQARVGEAGPSRARGSERSKQSEKMLEMVFQIMGEFHELAWRLFKWLDCQNKLLEELMELKVDKLYEQRMEVRGGSDRNQEVEV